MKEYHPPLGSRDALRLDFNENTLACSPRVREVLAQISAGALTRYPEREPVEAIVAAHLGLKPEQVALTNGVDEAIHVLFETFLEAATNCCCRCPPTPCTRSMPRRPMRGSSRCRRRTICSFRLSACSLRSRRARRSSPSPIPTARQARWPRARSFWSLPRRAPQAVLLVDEAYFHFYGETVIDLVGHDAEPGGRADIFEGLRARRTASRAACRAWSS